MHEVGHPCASPLPGPETRDGELLVFGIRSVRRSGRHALLVCYLFTDLWVLADLQSA